MRAFSVSLFSLCLAAVTSAGELDLAGDWRLSAAGGMVRDVPVRVPGGVYVPLIEKTLTLWDPFYSNKEIVGQWVGKTDWIYEREFDCPAALAAKRNVVLRLEDVDVFAEFFLNGVKVGETCDRFKRWEFPLDGVLKAGKNAIRVAFKSTDRKAFEIASSYDTHYPGSGHGTCARLNYVRTRQCSGGWDWGISAIDAGMMGTVKILDADPFRLDYVWCEQDFAADYSRCTVTVHAEITKADGAKKEAVSRVVVDRPKLWWPSGMGEQAMTEIAFAVEGVKMTKRIGLRKIETVMEPDADGGLSLGFRVNGVNVFAKGANWIPCDAYEHRQTPARYRDLLESAKAANMNMLRLWGGGQFEKDVFYDLCDELGLMVWHDFMFACQTAPTDERFFGLVRVEVRHQVKRLRDHAAIALWCGDNECVGYAWGQTPEDKAFYRGEHLKRANLIGSLLKELDPGRTYLSSSPYGGPELDGKLAKEQAYADTHSWMVWWHGAPFETFLGERPRFCSEYGFQSFPALEVVETFCPEGEAKPGSCAFEHHQKMPGGNRRILDAMARYVGVPKTTEGILYLSQQLQALAIKTATEGWRSLSPYCRGTLFWQLDDNWPVSSWSSIDYGGKWKPLQYHARRFFAPQLATVTTNGVVFCVNDRPAPVPAKLTLEEWTFDGRLASSRALNLELPADRAAEVARVTPRKDVFVVTRLETADGTHVNDRLFAPYREASLAPAKVKVRTDGCRVVLEADRPAFFVWANVRGIRGEFDDNSFTLLPGRPKTIVFTPKDEGVTPAAFRAALSVRQLADCDRASGGEK